jgi:hypothetical protein
MAVMPRIILAAEVRQALAAAFDHPAPPPDGTGGRA